MKEEFKKANKKFNEKIKLEKQYRKEFKKTQNFVTSTPQGNTFYSKFLF